MSVLSDGSIRRAIDSGLIKVDPFLPPSVQPSSLDVRCGYEFLVFHNSHHLGIDVREDMTDITERVAKGKDEPFILHPGEFVLGTTLETITLPDNIVARLEGKSSLGRLGLVIHSTAGFVDPGFSGEITLELSNTNNMPITLYPEMFIGQVAFQWMDMAVEEPYGSDERKSKYQGQRGPAASRMHENFETDEEVREWATPPIVCEHPDEPHTLWYMMEDGGPPTPNTLRFDDREDAVKQAKLFLQAEDPKLIWMKIFRSDNETYTCWRWHRDDGAEEPTRVLETP